VAAFIAGHKAVGVLPCAPRQPSCGMGRGMAGVRRKGAATCGGRRPMAATLRARGTLALAQFQSSTV
jgi:hypothetical protein